MIRIPVRTVLVIPGFFLVLHVGWPGPAAAQQRQQMECDLLRGASNLVRQVMGGRETIYISGPAQFVCTGGVRIRADSAVSVPDISDLQLIGNVFYVDSLKTLTANRVDYRAARILAQGNVILNDRATGSVIRSQRMDHRPESEEAPERSTFDGGRPHAVIYPRRSADAPPPEPETAARPMDVHADWMEIVGEDLFQARGRVELEQGTTRGFGDLTVFDQSQDLLVLHGQARVLDEDYTLVGERIEAKFQENQIREVVARRSARLTSEDMQVDALELQLYFEDGEPNRLIARSAMDADLPLPTGVPAAAPGRGRAGMPDPRVAVDRDVAAPPAEADAARAGAGEPVRPVVQAPDFRLVADSVDAASPGGRLERVVAVGEALGERAPDSLDLALPEVISRDWIRGDTVIAYFKDAEPAEDETPSRVAASAPPGDEATADPGTTAAEPAPDRVLERIVAIGPGGKAQALYRSREEGREHERPSVNFMVAERITLFMRAGEVHELEADGPVDGIHLEPTRDRAPPQGTGQGTGQGSRSGSARRR